VRELGTEPVPGQLVQEGDLVRHHPERLARLVMQVISDFYPERVVFLNNHIKQRKSSDEQSSAAL